jgi:hypothetical protein
MARPPYPRLTRINASITFSHVAGNWGCSTFLRLIAPIPDAMPRDFLATPDKSRQALHQPCKIRLLAGEAPEIANELPLIQAIPSRTTGRTAH